MNQIYINFVKTTRPTFVTPWDPTPYNSGSIARGTINTQSISLANKPEKALSATQP